MATSATCPRIRHIALTGRPGIGKTTLTKKIYSALRQTGVEVRGFYTEEIRGAGQRLGFDVVTLDGNRGPLARLQDNESGSFPQKRSYVVGKYEVKLNSFENIALPTLRITKNNQTGSKSQVFIIDEIGKMELFSATFVSMVQDILKCPTSTVITTIPIPKGKPIPFVEEIRNHPQVQVFTVTMENRNHIIEDIMKTINSVTV
ncbi:cancer-related nucleoside-triphosphatase-like [Crassostrea virginica]|uniref:Cancer-related nucleoside-triphosphatase-like isoform X2 n=1 Tax=Crassostrea virginica TaxID=6565 RepID=A0A8B8DQP6_CRAVI|nr:cancer-related nucleoside-triphosphatase-like isoform X2 [Crassostrea virginica]